MKSFMKQAVTATALGAAVVAMPAEADLSASAAFSVVGGTNLQVVLTNTSTDDVLVPSEVLTAVFFDVLGVGALTPVSALLTAGSSVFFDSDGQPAGGNVGGEWEYLAGLAGAPHGATEGISSAGFELFGGPNFNGPQLDPPDAVNGLNYGILSAGDNAVTGNTPVTGGNPLIKNSVTFLLSGLPTGFSLGDITNVSYQYGTSLDEPNIVPIPAAAWLFGSALMGVFGVGYRKKQAA